MKLKLNEDFTRLPRAGSFVRTADTGGEAARDTALLAHDERHLRRRVLVLQSGGKVLVDLPEPVALEHGDQLVLDEGGRVEIHAAQEEVYDIRARDRLHLAELCWHIGNRHLAAQIEEDRILILRDHVIRDMLTGLGARVSDAVEPFRPVRGAYSGHSHGHDHDHGERDQYGRLPGDPHYGHNHA
jgi:urease accessory protein